MGKELYKTSESRYFIISECTKIGKGVVNMSGSGIKVIANFISRNPKAFVEAATKVIGATRNEAGCNKTNFYREIGNTAEAGTERFVIVSSWKNEKALDQHMKEKHVTEFAKSFESHTIVEHIRRYEKIV